MIGKVSTPPLQDRRTDASLRLRRQQVQPPPSDYTWLVQLLMILYLLCFDIFVVAACSVPALICAQMASLEARYVKLTWYLKIYWLVSVALTRIVLPKVLLKKHTMLLQRFLLYLYSYIASVELHVRACMILNAYV